MKKLLLVSLFAFCLNANAQQPASADLSIKYYDVLTTIKKNPFFSFIGKHDKMIPVHDTKGTLTGYKIEGSDYTINFNSDTDVNIVQGAGNYYLTLVGNDMIGHGFLDDRKLNRVLTVYFQNDKVIKESVINHR